MNLYKNIPDCDTLGCHEAGVYYLINFNRNMCVKCYERSHMTTSTTSSNPQEMLDYLDYAKVLGGSADK